ncbi:DUF4168 domain-containing protein [Zunongwangia sp. F363]|uniref:DUF4168 domain-containing protein n=1 Tax=Autumnicola tepida TaxID=3075595 RepID=A0ABU3C9A1_9FLAO|nr:DUF4168 domain-containing protein [Zunongwangia sp. F363]MDT0642918.1 DUF4168 domain-containing protein [Zunongwangia sp. F363]
MFKSGKIKGLLMAMCMLFTIGAFAQTQPMPQQQKVEVDVDDSELANFAEAYQEIRMINQQAQQKMMAVVKDEGLEIQQFNKMYQASMNPNTEMEATAEQKEKYESAVETIEGMQGQFQDQMENAISEKGFTMERYEKLAMALQTDQEMQQRLQEMLSGQ